MPSKDASADQRLPTAALAFVLWGGWAVLANQSVGIAQAVLAGALQGTASAVITLIMAALATRLYHRFHHPLIKVLAPPCLIVSVSSSLLYLIHSLGQTPNLWLTIIPPSSLALAFCLYLTLRLAKQTRDSVAHSEPNHE